MFVSDKTPVTSGHRTKLLRELEAIADQRTSLEVREAAVLWELHLIDKAQWASARPTDLIDPLCERTRISRTDARRRTTRLTLLDEFPAVADALAAATITVGHVDCLVRGVPIKHLDLLAENVERLLAKAAVMTTDEFADSVRRWLSDASRAEGEDPEETRRSRRKLSLKRDRASGMTRISGLLDPESAAITRAALSEHERKFLREDQEAALNDPREKGCARTAPQRLADALVAVCGGVRASAAHGSVARGSGANGVGVVVTIPLANLLSGQGEAEIDGGGPVSAETARRLACENGVIPAVLGSRGAVLDLGRRRRLASEAQRLALHVEFGGCAIEGCDAPFDWCHVHHIDHWETGGPTDLSNLIPLCTRHHALVHAQRIDLPQGFRRKRDCSGDGAGSDVGFPQGRDFDPAKEIDESIDFGGGERVEYDSIDHGFKVGREIGDDISTLVGEYDLAGAAVVGIGLSPN
jgi:hypothetical protein